MRQLNFLNQFQKIKLNLQIKKHPEELKRILKLKRLTDAARRRRRIFLHFPNPIVALRTQLRKIKLDTKKHSKAKKNSSKRNRFRPINKRALYLIYRRRLFWYKRLRAFVLYSNVFGSEFRKNNKFNRIFPIEGSRLSSAIPFFSYNRIPVRTKKGRRYLLIPFKSNEPYIPISLRLLTRINLSNFFNKLSIRTWTYLIRNRFLLSNRRRAKIRIPDYSFSNLRDDSARQFFSIAHERMLKVSRYKFTRDINAILGIKLNHFVFKPILPAELTSSLFARFTTRRLSQRFSLFETIKVLKKYLHNSSLRGYLIKCSGRFTKKQRASIYTFRKGGTPASTWAAPVQYYDSHVKLKYGACCVKVWTYR